MENKKTEKKRIFSKLTVCVAALALVSCAFVGGTFARYTTGQQTTPGGTNVADWNIEIINEGEGFMELAPNMAEWSSGQRTYTVQNDDGSAMKVLEIHNNGQVAGMFKLAVDTSSYVLEDKEGNPIELPSYSAELNNPEWEDVSITDIFSVGVLSVVKNNDTKLTGNTTAGITNYSAKLEPGEYVIVSIASVVWTSDMDDATSGAYGDLRDTWLGENVSMVGYEMTWSVDQAENVPDGGTPAP